MSWTWSFVPHGGQWDFGDNPLVDWLRVLCVVLSMLLLMAVLRVLVEARRRPEHLPRTQLARFASLALFTVSVAMTEIAVAGSAGTPRLPLNLAAVVLGIYGVHGMRVKQRSVSPTS